MAAPGCGSQKCFCRAKKQGQSPGCGSQKCFLQSHKAGTEPSPGGSGLAGTPDSARVQTRTQQSLVQPQEIPRANRLCCWKRLPSLPRGFSPPPSTREHVHASTDLLGPALLSPSPASVFPQNWSGINTDNHFILLTPSCPPGKYPAASIPLPQQLSGQRHEVPTLGGDSPLWPGHPQALCRKWAMIYLGVAGWRRRGSP